MMNATQQLLSEINAFVARAGMAASTFGRLAVNDGKLVERLRGGRTVTLDTAERVRRFIAANPPAPAVAKRSGARA